MLNMKHIIFQEIIMYYKLRKTGKVNNYLENKKY